VGIVARSGNVISASMKVFAELSTVIGLHISRNILKSPQLSWALGLIARVAIMSVVNLYLLPNVYGVPYSATMGLLPLIGLFNIIQGLIAIALGHFLYVAIRKRLP